METTGFHEFPGIILFQRPMNANRKTRGESSDGDCKRPGGPILPGEGFSPVSRPLAESPDGVSDRDASRRRRIQCPIVSSGDRLRGSEFVVPEKMKNASTGQPGGRLVKPSGLVKREKM
jgi:hypothetical protein